MSDHSITSLIEKLEGAEGPSLVLDGEIWCAVNGYTFVMWDGAGCVYRRASDGGISHEQASRIRPFSASLDAALALVERVLDGDCSYDLFHDFGGFNRAKVHGITNAPVWGEGKAETMPLALCIAILRAQSEARV